MCPGSWGRGTKASLADLPNASHTKRFCMATRQPLPHTHKHTCTRPRPSQNCIYDGACQKSVAVPAVTVVVTPWPSPRARHTGQQQQSPPASPPAVRGPSPQNGFHCSHSTRISIHEGPSLARPNPARFQPNTTPVHDMGARYEESLFPESGGVAHSFPPSWSAAGISRLNPCCNSMDIPGTHGNAPNKN